MLVGSTHMYTHSDFSPEFPTGCELPKPMQLFFQKLQVWNRKIKSNVMRTTSVNRWDWSLSSIMMMLFPNALVKTNRKPVLFVWMILRRRVDPFQVFHRIFLFRFAILSYWERKDTCNMSIRPLDFLLCLLNHLHKSNHMIRYEMLLICVSYIQTTFSHNSGRIRCSLSIFLIVSP